MSEQLNRTPTSRAVGGGAAQRTIRLRVELEIAGMCVRHGVNRIGFLTFTFADDVRTIKEAQRRFNSMNSHALSGRYVEWLGVVQRHADNRIHFHLVVVMREDIRTGFNFEAVKRRDYTSASAYLRAEWAFLRAALPEYSFGRHELLPIRIADGFGRYVARYVGRAGNTRQDEKGARLVRFSKGFQRVICGAYCKLDVIDKRARDRTPQVVEMLGWRSQNHLEEELGPRWKYHLARILYCDERAFWAVLVDARDSLTLYGGRLCALREAFDQWDADLPERTHAQELRQLWLEHIQAKAEGSGVRVTPVSQDTGVPGVVPADVAT